MASGLNEIVTIAREELTELLGQEAERVASVHHDDDGWRVIVDVVELSRIPPSTDVLASYELHLDDDGALQSYERTQRFVRGASTNGHE